MVHVNHKIAGLELCKIAEETRSANFVAGPLDRGGDVEQIRVAVDG